MHDTSLLRFTLAAFVMTAACSGGGSPATTPTAPSSGGATSPVTVAIVGIDGNRSYRPNPVQSTGQAVVFRNDDTVAHRIVMDDGSADFGTLTPGASSAARAVNGGNYHCTLHPSMVGSINGTAAPEPPAGSGNGY